MRFEFHPEALGELEAAADFYAERNKGLEIRFIDAVSSAIRRAGDSPSRWRVFDRGIRRVLVHVFP
jgi:plasmid stabilization system protein ParE